MLLNKGSVKLTKENVVEIIECLNKKEKVIDIAKKFNVSRWTITNIRKGHSWNMLEIELSKINNSKYTIEEINKVRELLNNNLTVKEVSLQTIIPIGIIYKIKNRHNYGM